MTDAYMKSMFKIHNLCNNNFVLSFKTVFNILSCKWTDDMTKLIQTCIFVKLSKPYELFFFISFEALSHWTDDITKLMKTRIFIN